MMHERHELDSIYRDYAEHRERAAVHVTEAVGGARYCLYRYADVAAALKDRRFGAAPAPAPLLRALRWTGFGSLATVFESGLLVALNPPDHTRLRRIIDPFFSGKAAELMKPLVQETIEQLLAEVQPTGRFDLIADFAAPLPTRVIAEVFGFPKEDLPRLKQWSADLASLIDSDFQRTAWMRRLSAFFGFRRRIRQLIAFRRHAPAKDLLSTLAHARHVTGDLSEAELVGTTIFVLTAGHATTTHLIGSAAQLLLSHPRELDRLREDPGLVDQATEEAIRLETPIQRTGRVLLEDVEVQGQRIRRGAKIRLMLGSANRDPRRFENPDRFDLLRADSRRHVGFGGGIHQCLGLHLARLETRLAIGALVSRFPGLALVGEETRWVEGTKFRGPSRLVVRA